MARSVSATTIILRARRAVDKEADTAWVTDAELIDRLNVAWPRLYAIHVKAYPERYQSTQTITLSDATGVVAVSSDYFGTIGVDYRLDSSNWLKLFAMQEEERNIFNGTTTGQALAYRVLGSNLNLYPAPPSGQVYRHIYLPTAATISAGSDSIDGVLGHEQILVLELAIYMALKEESDARMYIEERDKLIAEVQEEAQMRSVYIPRHVQDEQSSNAVIDPADWRWKWGGT